MPNLLSYVYVKRNYETRRISHLFGQQSNVVMTYECCVDPQKERSTYGCFRGGSDWFEQKSRQPCLVPKRRKKTAKTGSWQSQERGASFRHQSLHLVVRATFTGLGIAHWTQALDNERRWCLAQNLGEMWFSWLARFLVKSPEISTLHFTPPKYKHCKRLLRT